MSTVSSAGASASASPGFSAAKKVHRQPTQRTNTAKKANHSVTNVRHTPRAPPQEARLDRTLADLAARREAKRTEIRDNTEGASRNHMADINEHDRQIATLLRSAKDQHQAIHRQQRGNQNVPKHATMEANPWTLGVTKRPLWKGNHIKGGKRKRRRTRKKRRSTRKKRRSTRRKRRRSHKKRKSLRTKRKKKKHRGGMLLPTWRSIPVGGGGNRKKSRRK